MRWHDEVIGKEDSYATSGYTVLAFEPVLLVLTVAERSLLRQIVSAIAVQSAEHAVPSFNTTPHTFPLTPIPNTCSGCPAPL